MAPGITGGPSLPWLATFFPQQPSRPSQTFPSSSWWKLSTMKGWWQGNCLFQWVLHLFYSSGCGECLPQSWDSARTISTSFWQTRLLPASCLCWPGSSSSPHLLKSNLDIVYSTDVVTTHTCRGTNSTIFHSCLFGLFCVGHIIRIGLNIYEVIQVGLSMSLWRRNQINLFNWRLLVRDLQKWTTSFSWISAIFFFFLTAPSTSA